MLTQFSTAETYKQNMKVYESDDEQNYKQNMKVYGSDDEQDVTGDRIKIGIAEHAVTTNGSLLTTSGLGSCIGIVIYDEESEVSGLAHIMLPSSEEVEDENESKFADTGVDAMIDEMIEEGASKSGLKAKIAGGSDMLDFSNSGGSVGTRNIDAVREILDDKGIPIVSEDVGGDHGRSIEFNPITADLKVKSANKGEETI